MTSMWTRLCWSRCSASLAAPLLAGLLLLPAPVGGVEGERARTRMVVNGEAITQGDLESVRAAPGRHPLGEDALLEQLVEETLLRQEAERRGVGSSPAFRRAVDEWRRDTAPNLVGVEYLRLQFPESERGSSFDEFYADWRDRYFSLDGAKRAEVDRAVNDLLFRLRSGREYELKRDVMQEYAYMADIPPEKARQVAVATTPWGEITLDEVLAKEPSTLGHVSQGLSDVLKMWEKIVAEIVAREGVYRAAEEKGLFQAPAVQALERVNRRRLLKTIFLGEYFARTLSPERVNARIAEGLGPWTEQFGLELEILRTEAETRLQANDLFHRWQELQELPADLPEKAGTLARLPLDEGWQEIGEDLRGILLSQQWGKLLPPFREEGTFVIARIRAREMVPGGESTLVSLARNFLQAEAYQTLMNELRKKATIERP